MEVPGKYIRASAENVGGDHRLAVLQIEKIYNINGIRCSTIFFDSDSTL